MNTAKTIWYDDLNYKIKIKAQIQNKQKTLLRYTTDLLVTRTEIDTLQKMQRLK